MADLAGRLQIELRPTPERLAVGIHSTRPLSASRLFVGKGVAETISCLPALFSVCSTAQAAACVQACEPALGRTATPETARLRSQLVDAETLREHFWRVLLDWPRLLGGTPDGAAMAGIMATSRRLRTALSTPADPMQLGASGTLPEPAPALRCLDELTGAATQHLFDQSPKDWLCRTASAEALTAWARNTDTVAARMLREVQAQGWAAHGSTQVPSLPPKLPTDELESRLAGPGVDEFIAMPDWKGAPAESSPYSRNRRHPAIDDLQADCGNGLLPRLLAQLVELASLLARLQQGIEVPESPIPQPAPPWPRELPEGIGIAQVQAARGLLVHRVALRGEQVMDYRILAPTEWNFHPCGLVTQGLATLPEMDDGDLRRLTGLFVTAVDPCVDYAVTIFREGPHRSPVE